MTGTAKEDRFEEIARKMRADGVADIAIANFRNHYTQVLQGNTGFIPESSIQPVDELPDLGTLDQQYSEHGKTALARTVLLKLNGGLGTSMGLERAKSLITIKQDYSFLDIIAQHAIWAGVPLLLMNSFSTREDSLAALQAYALQNNSKLPLDFVQHKVPKLAQHDLSPAACSTNRQLEWCPPGHGDLYIALVSSGMLGKLLTAGYHYALVSNADNLGAILDTQLLGYMVAEQIPFLMEVTDRTAADRKGGHLARGLNGRLILRESAQCLEADRETFEDIHRHRFFNTNNLWIDLQRLRAILDENNNILDLPLIRNAKTLDPKDPGSTPVYQLETAMGSAISIFDGARAIRVPRSRFAPVKTTSDLLLVRSDVFELNQNYTLASRLAPGQLPRVRLDHRFYGLIEDFESRFPHGPPSLLNCEQLDIDGDILFGANVSVTGRVVLKNRRGEQASIESGTSVETDMSWD